MDADVVVLGAGMVGVSVAVHLARRGRNVVLVDRRGPGEETSQGNAGLIQQEGVLPHAFPQNLAKIVWYGLNASRDMRYHLLDLPRFAPYLVRYWWASRPQAYHRMVRTYAKLIAHAVPEHAALVELAGAHNLIVKNGWIEAYRTASALDESVAEAQWLEKEFGIRHAAFDGSALQRLEPALRSEVAGAVHWLDPWTVRSPLQLTQAYFGYFTSLGGRFVTGDARTASPRGRQGWSIETEQGALGAREVVIALGPWSTDLTRRLGYDIPLAVQRGYSMHYRLEGSEPPRHWIADREMGYLVAPMLHGIRITTGAEIADRDAPKTPVQLQLAEQTARTMFPLGDRIDPEPWMGARPCMPDMLPVIGPAPSHAGLWFAFGHAHHGLTLGPATGRLIAELMTGEQPFVDPAPFSAWRFRSGRASA